MFIIPIPGFKIPDRIYKDTAATRPGAGDMAEGMGFWVQARQGRARAGALRLPRGEIRTPAFMPVGTAGTVKAMLPESVAATGADVLLGNTYHLMLRPGAERVA